MWRLSSRKCAVIPSAPAASHTIAASTGSGSAPRRACRSVATWSILIYSRCCFARIAPVPESQLYPAENFIVPFRKIAGLFLLAACSSATQRMGSNGQVTGAASAQLAVDQFLQAVNAKDLQAMSTVFGTKDGPARETMDRTELEKREVILACYFNHDTARILGEQGGLQGHREIRVQLNKGNLSRETTFYAIKGPGGRWYVDNMDIAAVRDFCGNPGTSTRRQ